MLTKEKLMQLMTDLESETVERTRAFDKAEKMGQAISAFANDLPGRGIPGYLLPGVEDNGQLSRRRVTDEQMTSLGGLKTEGNLLPSPSLCIEKFTFEDGDVVAIEVFPTAAPPVRFRGQAWVRVGSRKALASEADLHIFEERRQHSAQRFETKPCTDSNLRDLDLDLFQNIYLPRAIKAEIIENDPRPIEEQLAALRFFDIKAKVPTNLGMILFGKHPEMYIPSAYIQYVKFSGFDNGSDILAEHAYKGPLLRTIDELNAFIKIGITLPHSVKISPLQEEIVYHYPDWAIRELLLNAIIHRDYQLGNAPVKFYNYNDTRLELSNPGGLYGLAKPDNFPLVNDYRNPLLAGAMKVMGFVNQFNRGITKVKLEMAANGNPAPIFDYNKLTEFRATILVSTKISPVSAHERLKHTMNSHNDSDDKLKTENDKLKTENDELKDKLQVDKLPEDFFKGMESASREKKILRLVEAYPGIRRKKMAQCLEISLGTLDRALREMTKDHQNAHIEHRGSRKFGGWFRRT